MSLPDEGARINPQKRRTPEELAEIKSILRVKNVTSFERLMQAKATWITRVLEEIDSDWAGSFYPYYVGDYDRNFPEEEIRERLQNALKCCESYAKEGPNFICRQPMICPVCASDNAHEFAQQKVKLLVAKIKQRQNTLRVIETVVHLGACGPEELPNHIRHLIDVRQRLRRAFRDRQRNNSPRGNFSKDADFLSLDMFIHVAPSSRSTGELFPHLHVVAIPRTNIYSASEFYEFINSRIYPLGMETLNLSEKRYAIEEKHRVEGVSNFQKRMHYLARLTKNQQINYQVKMHASSSIPTNFRQRTSFDEGDRVGNGPRYKNQQANKQTLVYFDRESGKFQLL